jgi:arylsulfatase A-like enzyme
VPPAFAARHPTIASAAALVALIGLGCRPPIPDPDEPTPEIVQIEPEQAYAIVHDLRCAAAGAASFSWRIGDLPLSEGASTTTLPGDTVPGALLVPGATYTCTAHDADGATIAEAQREVSRPSIVLMVADDLGYGDTSTFGHSTLATPALDRLADEGARLTRGYVTAHSCSPSRAGLLTGRQQNRFGFEYNMGVEDDPSGVGDRGLPVGEQTLGDVLGAAGLATALVGKWHVGERAEFHPNVRGFDHFFGITHGQALSLPPGQPGVVEIGYTAHEVAQYPLSADGGSLERNGVAVIPDPARHLTDQLVDEAIAWVEQTTPAPFFLYLAFNAPHVPLQAGPEYLDLLSDPPTDVATLAYHANIAGLDRAVGRLLSSLDALNLTEHTLVVFTSDNGCPDVADFCSNAPFQGGKLTLTEGGVRVPWLVRWPGRVPVGTDVHDPVTTIDLMPTFVVATGAAPPAAPLDGTDLLPALQSGSAPARDMFWRSIPVRAVQSGDYKLVHAFDLETGGERRWLFNLATDPTERTNLADGDPELVDELLQKLDDRARATYSAPAWQPRGVYVDYYGELVPILY